MDADAPPVTAMRARELGRKSVVVGDRVALVGDTSGAAGALARIVRIATRTSVLRRTADDDDTHHRGPARTGGRGQRRPAGDRQRARRPAAAYRVHRPLPGGRLRRRHRAAALPHQGRPGRPGGGARLLRRAGPAARAGPARTATWRAAHAARRPGLGDGRALRRRQVDPGQPAGAGGRTGGRHGQRDRPGPAHLDQRRRPARCRRRPARSGYPAGSSTPRASAASGWRTCGAESLLHGFPDLVEGTLRLPGRTASTPPRSRTARSTRGSPRAGRTRGGWRRTGGWWPPAPANSTSDPPPAVARRGGWRPGGPGSASVCRHDLLLRRRPRPGPRARRHRRRDLHGAVPRARPARSRPSRT